MSILRLTRRSLLGCASAALSSCSAVGAFNALVPFDEGATRVASGLAYGSSDRQRLDLYVAPRAIGRPGILFIYGGAWTSGERADYAFVGQALASRGFLVAIADYRLVPEVKYPLFLDDCALAFRWLQGHAGSYGGNAGKLFVMGHSAGAYNALMIALDDSIAASVGLDRRAIKGAIGLAGPYDFLPLDDPATIGAFGEWPRLSQTQPINHVAGFAPPILLASGDADETVYPRNSATLAAKLRAAGHAVDLRIYPGIGHAEILTALSRTFRDKAPVLDDVSRFVSAHGRSEKG